MLRLKDIMNAEVATIPAHASADDARALMRSKGFRHLIVVAAGRILGVLSLTDLGGRFRSRTNGGGSVGTLMTQAPITAEPDMSVRQAARVLRAHAIGCLPVCRDRKLLGIVTISDLLETLGNGLDAPPPPRERRAASTRKRRDSTEWGYPRR